MGLAIVFPQAGRIEILDSNPGGIAFVPLYACLLQWTISVGDYHRVSHLSSRFSVIPLHNNGEKQTNAIDSGLFMAGNAINAVRGVDHKGVTNAKITTIRESIRDSLFLESDEPLNKI